MLSERFAVVVQPAQAAFDDLIVHLRHHRDGLLELVFHVFVQHVVQPRLDAVAEEAGDDEREEEQREDPPLLGAEAIAEEKLMQPLFHGMSSRVSHAACRTAVS